MSFTHLRYDACTYAHDLRQSLGVGEYVFTTPTPECVACLNATACGAGGPSRVDVQSELRGITRKASRCPADMASSMPQCQSTKVANCRPILDEHTRLSNPPCTLRGSGVNRFQWLCTNPQLVAERPFQADRSNRLMVKDCYRPQVDVPLDPSDVLPRGGAPVQLGLPCAAEPASHPPFNTVWRDCASHA